MSLNQDSLKQRIRQIDGVAGCSEFAPALPQCPALASVDLGRDLGGFFDLASVKRRQPFEYP
jgi:hypothetical protein